jgi:hypothetical protein
LPGFPLRKIRTTKSFFISARFPLLSSFFSTQPCHNKVANNNKNHNELDNLLRELLVALHNSNRVALLLQPRLPRLDPLQHLNVSIMVEEAVVIEVVVADLAAQEARRNNKKKSTSALISLRSLCLPTHSSFPLLLAEVAL